ncbi:MAG: outer membrane protein assembly factor BamA [Planctomycetota bacterium]|jgi:outer membrane protein assembly complex protein YaeT
MKKPQKVLLILFLFLNFCFLILRVEGAEQVIGSIKTAGNRSITESRILSRVRSRVGDVFDADTAAEDAKRIAEISGVEYSYYNQQVIDGKIHLTFVVREQEIVRLVKFIGNSKYKTKKLAKKVGIKAGDYLETMAAEAAAETLADFYREKGFAFVKVGLDSEGLDKGQVIYRIDEGPRVKIESVGFSGNQQLSSRKLKRAVKTKKKKWVFLTSYYSEEKVDKDVTRLRDAYYERGFLDSRVKAERQFNMDRNKARITFVVEEGPVYTVEQVVITGHKFFDESELRSALELEAGQVYSERKADSMAKDLVKLYRETGFIDSQVEPTAKFVAADRVRLEFSVTEGERFKIGRVDITGNEETQDKVVRHILDEYEFQPGRWYNADIARGDGSGYLEKLIRRTAYTGSATISALGDYPDKRDALVSITEGQTGLVMLGAGVASDSGMIGQLVFEQRNFDIRDKPESLYELITGRAFKGAGQNLRISLQPGTEVSEYSISFTEPYFRDKPVSLNVVGSSWERWRESYDEGRTKGFVGFEKRQKSHWRKSIGFRAENVEVSDVDYDAPQEIYDVKGDNLLYGVRFGIGRDLRDDKFNPSQGHNFDISYEQVGGDHTFGVLSGAYRRYRTLRRDLAERKTVLATKLLAATTIGDAPPFEKFYAGGSGKYGIRGFDYRGVSTRGLPTNRPSTERDDPIGSDWVFLANAEVTVPLVGESLSSLFFVDSGAIDDGSYRVSVGTGIQILLPQWFGPVPMRLEIAAPVMKDDADDTQVFSFSVGRLF